MASVALNFADRVKPDEALPELLPLPRSFYQPSAARVAPRLLGHWLVRRTNAGLCAGLIVETEAYVTGDPAAHGYRGETLRNRAMFGPPGHAYVYFIYGNHWCVNAVCRPAGTAEAVLIRAIDPRLGLESMSDQRVGVKRADWSNGPGKLCAAMRIDRRHDAGDLCDAASSLFIAHNPRRKSLVSATGPVVVTTRIGLSRAMDRLLRFYLAGNPYVSRRLKIRLA